MQIAEMGSIPIIQINLHHSKAGTTELCCRLSQMKRYIVLVQEPWIINNRICGLPKRGLISSDSKEKLRSCVIVSPDIKVWPLSAFTDADCVAISTKWQGNEVIFASAYMPGDRRAPSRAFRSLVMHCENNETPLVVGCDSNAHHTLWGSTNVNERGELLLEYLMGTQLEIMNRGNTPTFINAIRQEVLDITLVTTDLQSRVEGWHVDPNASGSDHRYIMFDIRLGLPDPIFYRNRHKTDWPTYALELDEKLACVPISAMSNTVEIEERVNKVTEIMVKCFHDACPLKKVRPDCPNKRFWKPELSALRREVRRLDRCYVTENYSDTAHSRLKEARGRYEKAILKARREAWRGLVADIETMPQASRLHKLLTGDVATSLRSLKKQDGSYTEGPEETLDLLLEIHFPGDPNRDTGEADNRVWDSDEIDSIMNPTTVRRAINSFGLYKAGGPDGIFPAMLRYAQGKLVPHLVEIMKACLAMGYVPTIWRRTRAAFIPKPGKDSYSLANSWRPISLTSFLVKTMERLIDRHVRTPALVEGLKTAGQYAYLRGSSTEGALHQFVAVAERALSGKEYAAGVLLDIAGAFSHATHRSLIAAMRREGLSELCVRWIACMLTNRSAEAEIGDVVRTRRVERGCPQGGVLSPLLWNLLITEVLTRLKRRLPQLLSQAFADDLGLIQLGHDLGTVLDICQQGLNVVSRWCREVDLGVEASKSQTIIFTARLNYEARPLYINGDGIPVVSEAKYLGVILDRRLTWLPHCRARARKCQVALAQCKRALSKTWGLKPFITAWLYTSIIRPTLCFGAVVWLPAVYKLNNLLVLQRVQRLGLTSICGPMRTTPTAALECLFGIPPIDIYIEGLATRAMARLQRSGQWLYWAGRGKRTARLGHIDICTKLGSRVLEIALPCDHKTDFLPTCQYMVQVKTRKEWEEQGSPVATSPGITCFTDGSKLEELAGSGYCISGPGTLLREAEYPLGKYITVFQAEVYAISQVASRLNQEAQDRSPINVYVDCQSALDSLTSEAPQGQLVRECAARLNALASNRKLTLHWIPAHKGYSGNEYVDRLAKKAAETPFIGPEPSIPISVETVNSAIDGSTTGRWRARWRTSGECRQTKAVLPDVSRAYRFQCLRLSRILLRILVQVVTGHCLLAKHMCTMRITNDPTCPLCKREDEDRDHFVLKCEALTDARNEVFGFPELKSEDLANVSLPSLLKFSLRTKRFQRNQQGDDSTN